MLVLLGEYIQHQLHNIKQFLQVLTCFMVTFCGQLSCTPFVQLWVPEGGVVSELSHVHVGNSHFNVGYSLKFHLFHMWIRNICKHVLLIFACISYSHVNINNQHMHTLVTDSTLGLYFNANLWAVIRFVLYNPGSKFTKLYYHSILY